MSCGNKGLFTEADDYEAIFKAEHQSRFCPVELMIFLCKPFTPSGPDNEATPHSSCGLSGSHSRNSRLTFGGTSKVVGEALCGEDVCRLAEELRPVEVAPFVLL
ncbi:hypothetical protein IAD21_00080 [Abditibacteriota bacterium]|nr:hypothetical protein IAD21_00080 [Abditibacteriota bacterium]